MKTLSVVAIAFGLLLVPATGLAQTELPVGEAHGVRVVREHRAIVVVLSPKLHKRLAGRNVIVSCTTLLEDGSGSGSQVMRVPRRGRKLFTGDLTPNIDYCRLSLPRNKHRPKRILVSVPLTQEGAVFIDEETKATTMFGVFGLAELAQKKLKLEGAPTYAQLLQAIPNRARAAFAKRVVALAAPTDSPPPKKVGYYSDGQERVAVAILSASGRRLFVEVGPDDFFSTNVLGYLFNERD